MEENVKFPLTFDQCPNCDSERRVANEVIQEQKDAGTAKESTRAWLFSHESLIADMGKPHIQVPVVLSFFDACVDCGTVYCVRIEVKMVTPQTGRPKTPPFSLS